MAALLLGGYNRDPLGIPLDVFPQIKPDDPLRREYEDKIDAIFFPHLKRREFEDLNPPPFTKRFKGNPSDEDHTVATVHVDPHPSDKNIIPGVNPFIMSAYGKPGSGKTQLMQRIVYQKLINKQVDYVIVITPNGWSEDWKFLPRKCVKTEWTQKLAEKIYKVQQSPERGHLLIVCEDQIGSFPWTDPLVTKMLISHRHLDTSWVFGLQYVNKQPPIYRETNSQVAIFDQLTLNAKEALWKSFGTAFWPDYKDWEVALKEYTEEKYFFMWYDAWTHTWTRKKIKPLPKDTPVIDFLKKKAGKPNKRKMEE